MAKRMAGGNYKGREDIPSGLFAVPGSTARATAMFQAHALRYLLLPGFAAEGLAALDAAANRFQFSFGSMIK
jgi:hypothetical protein